MERCYIEAPVDDHEHMKLYHLMMQLQNDISKWNVRYVKYLNKPSNQLIEYTELRKKLQKQILRWIIEK